MHGAHDAYTTTVVRTRAMAECAIEGDASDYELTDPTNTYFKYSRFGLPRGSAIAPRDASMLVGAKEFVSREVIFTSSEEVIVS